jgi:hypothetical protein
MRLLVAAALAALVAAPSAARPGEARDVSEYNNTLVEIAGEVMERIEEAEENFAHLEPGLRFDAWRTKSLDELRRGVRAVDAVAPRDDDEGFRAGVRDGLVTSERIIEVMLTEAFALSSKEQVANADLARFEALYRELESEAERVDSSIRDTQRAFARAHGMRLVQRKSRRRETEQDFSAPGIPPAGSHLPGQVHVSFALRYGNALIAEQNALSRASAAAVQAEGAALDEARKAALREVREIAQRLEAVESWQGDDGLRAGAIAMAHELETSLAGPTKEYARLARRDALDAEEVERANALIGEMNASGSRAHEAFANAQAAFRARWAIPEYEAWVAQREAEERERDERRRRRQTGSEST